MRDIACCQRLSFRWVCIVLFHSVGFNFYLSLNNFFVNEVVEILWVLLEFIDTWSAQRLICQNHQWMRDNVGVFGVKVEHIVVGRLLSGIGWWILNKADYSLNLFNLF